MITCRQKVSWRHGDAGHGDGSEVAGQSEVERDFRLKVVHLDTPHASENSTATTRARSRGDNPDQRDVCQIENLSA